MKNNVGAPYAWLALWALVRFHGDNEGSDGDELQRISAVAGQFRRPVSNAANDQAGTLLILLLIWWLTYAKYRAKLAESRALSRELLGAQFHPVFPAHTRLLLALPGFALILALCQNDHLPTLP